MALGEISEMVESVKPKRQRRGARRFVRKFAKLYKKLTASPSSSTKQQTDHPGIIKASRVPSLSLPDLVFIADESLPQNFNRKLADDVKPRSKSVWKRPSFLRRRRRSHRVRTQFASADHDAPFAQSLLNREWEIVTVEEVRRRLSLSDLSTTSNLPLPSGCQQSRILDTPRLRQFMEVLPARAEGYPWCAIYSSHEHGFSLRTLYRRMGDWDDDLSPTVLVVRDTSGRVFGACVSAPIRLDEHGFFGRGDACFLFTYVPLPSQPSLAPPESPTRVESLSAAPPSAPINDGSNDELRVFGWTGTNQWFVKASPTWLAIGAGAGHYGLWLDADLNHGRTQRCDTFDNEPLTDTEDFIVDAVECWGFALDL